MKKYRLLHPEEIECRVATCNEKGVSILLYKTARTDADLLDETVGCENWENDFKVVDGTLYGGLGVDYGKGYIWKWDAGTESFTEKEKGRASDAFKRAGFKHGIGRELYSAPFIWIPASKCKIKEKNGRWVCNDDFIVTDIGYDKDERICHLIITVNSLEVYRMGVKPPSEGNYSPDEEKADTGDSTASGGLFVPNCADCGVEITDRVHDFSVKKYGRPLCMSCQKKQ